MDSPSPDQSKHPDLMLFLPTIKQVFTEVIVFYVDL